MRRGGCDVRGRRWNMGGTKSTKGLGHFSDMCDTPQVPVFLSINVCGGGGGGLKRLDFCRHARKPVYIILSIVGLKLRGGLYNKGRMSYCGGGAG